MQKYSNMQQKQTFGASKQNIIKKSLKKVKKIATGWRFFTFYLAIRLLPSKSTVISVSGAISSLMIFLAIRVSTFD